MEKKLLDVENDARSNAPTVPPERRVQPGDPPGPIVGIKKTKTEKGTGITILQRGTGGWRTVGGEETKKLP